MEGGREEKGKQEKKKVPRHARRWGMVSKGNDGKWEKKRDDDIISCNWCGLRLDLRPRRTGMRLRFSPLLIILAIRVIRIFRRMSF